METEALGSNDRRDFLVKLTSVVGGAGVAAACVPFVASMNPSPDVLAKGVTEVDISGIPPGGMHTVAWQGKPVFILHRTPEEIAAAEGSNGVIDPQPDKERVKKPEWLVVVAICTHMGCVPNQEGAGFVCHCHGSQYDDSGRVTHGPAPRNLAVPPYYFLTDTKILIGNNAA